VEEEGRAGGYLVVLRRTHTHDTRHGRTARSCVEPTLLSKGRGRAAQQYGAGHLRTQRGRTGRCAAHALHENGVGCLHDVHIAFANDMGSPLGAATRTVTLLLLSLPGIAAQSHTERPAVRSAPAAVTAQRSAQFSFGTAVSPEVCT